MPANRQHPRDCLKAVLPLPQKISDGNAGRPMNRLLMVEALGGIAGVVLRVR